MKINIYIKNQEDIEIFDNVINKIKELSNNIFITSENRRNFRELENLKSSLSKDDIVIISDIASLGLNEADIANQLNWFIQKQQCLAICNYESTYEYGINQPLNMAILSTVLQSILNENKNVIELPRNKKKNSGRNKISFPDNWDELYDKWKNKEISSNEFIKLSNLKKATFYNLLTEYKSIQESKQEYIKRYRIS